MVGILTMKITNGGTGPTVHVKGAFWLRMVRATPTAASAGSDWKRYIIRVEE